MRSPDLYLGDCLFWLAMMPDNSVDAVVTDPPYGLSFMGKRWDYDVPSEAIWRECLRVLKPGGHLLAFAGTRTQHRMAVRIEDAGFEIRDMIAWVYGSGFPKSLDVSKALEAHAKTGRSDSQVTGDGRSRVPGQHYKEFRKARFEKAEFTPATEAARQWQGWGTALKPALEPITVARKPLIGTVAENVLAHGTGAINVDGCRVDASGGRPLIESKGEDSRNCYGNGLSGSRSAGTTTEGRWPANLIHDGSDEVVAGFPGEADGSAARFFYCAKTSKRDRDEGLEGFEVKNNMRVNGPRESEDAKHATLRANHHPTVKPTDLMRYLCRLVTPPGGTVLDPFMGSGSTGKAAALEGFHFIGMERDADYFTIAQARIDHARKAD